MGETYTRKGYIALKKETAINTPVTPDVFVPINDEDLSVDYAYSPSMAVQGNRAMNLRAIVDKILTPGGTLNLNVEPKTFGYFMEGIQDLTSGVYFKVDDADNGDIAVGDTIDNGSTGSAEVLAIDSYNNVLICGSVSGDWATGDTVDNGGTHSSTLGTYSGSVYAHLARIPGDITNTFTIERGLADMAVRFIGCRFHGLDAITQSDNIVTAGVQVRPQGAFSHTKVTAAVTAGAGAKSIPVDQTYGLVASDTIKVWRSGTGFLDFSASSVKTHTIGTVDSANSELDITNLEVALQEGDIIVLAPQTPSYTVADEFPWIGGSQMSAGGDVSSLSNICVEEFSMTFTSEMEERHCASGTGIAARMPSKVLEKGFTGEGSFTLPNQSQEFYRHYRLNTSQAVQFQTTGGEIASTGINYQLFSTFAEVQYDQYDLPITQDDILNEEVPFTSFYSEDDGYSVQLLLVNDIASY